jgi:hypothetical protein
MGSPLRVISSGWPVRLTLSRRARQVALNFEMLSVSIAMSVLWSVTMVNHSLLNESNRAAADADAEPQRHCFQVAYDFEASLLLRRAQLYLAIGWRGGGGSPLTNSSPAAIMRRALGGFCDRLNV